MGTFHDGRGDLHGITVVVDTRGSDVWAGRCDTVQDGRIVLVGADHHEAVEGAPTKDEWVRRAAMVGVHPRHDRVVLPLDQVVSVRKLGDISL